MTPGWTRVLAHLHPTLVRVADSVAPVGTEHVRWLAEPKLNRPVLVAAFTGWNDAGDSASIALRTMIEAWGAEALAEIDPEVFTDFATVRPHVRLDDDQHRSIVWPTVGVWSVSLPGTDVILVLGPEPALRWRLFCEQIEGIAEAFGVTMAISLGALLADVPHSRPVPLIGTATDESLIERFELRRSQYEGPTGIVGVLHDALHQQRVGHGVAVGCRTRLRLADPVAQGGDGARRAGLLDDRHPGPTVAPRRRGCRLRRPGRVA